MARPLTKTFDPKCYELAKAFIEDVEAQYIPPEKHEEHCNLLAATIQEAIEDYIKWEVYKEGEEESEEITGV